MILSDFHAHTTLCDGNATPEEMVLAAINRGLVAFGLSGHAFMNKTADWWMSEENTARYLAETAALKQKYAGQIELYTGFETDYFCPPVPPCDYQIGSLHFVSTANGRFSIDYYREFTQEIIKNEFGGDPYAFCENYYELLAGVAEKTGADIIGHFDLVTKYNEDPQGALFDESNPRYVKAALDALHELVKADKPFEINTGAMFRGRRKTPYPAPFILRELHRLGGRIMLNSDAHSTDGILYAFDTASTLARACGFTEAVTISNGKLTETAI